MSAPNLVPVAEALAAISREQEAAETLQAQLILQVRLSLRPLGLSNDPKEWHSGVHAAMTALNRDYRHAAKVAIFENARKIRKSIGTNGLVLSVLEVAKMYASAEIMHEGFKRFYAAQEGYLQSGERAWYQEALRSLEGSIKAFRDMFVDTRERLATFTPAFRILERPTPDVRAFSRSLDKAASQRQNVVAARPLLSRLADLHNERQTIEKQRGAMFAHTRAILMKDPITRGLLERQLSKFSALTNCLHKQTCVQNEILAELEKCFDIARSTPSNLPGIIEGTTVPVATLLNASAAFTAILDSVELMRDMYENFAASIGRLTTRLLERNTPNSSVMTS
ncbi:hypothetical protein BV20DRAFT_1048101 [Pilatotrama ljubarskyi]|nr:hypothetical protein BV20DRAFT_1048101 [Pilatotrama ljubarskyi]